VKVLFDVNTPRKLRSLLNHHEVITAQEQGWEKLANGELLRAAETAGFDIMVTADQNIAHQQNLKNRRIALVVLSTNAWRVVRTYGEAIAAAVDSAKTGSYAFIEMPPPKLRTDRVH
jgi:hypothetical protein